MRGAVVLACAMFLCACDPKPAETKSVETPPASTSPKATLDYPLDALEPTVRRQISETVARVQSNPDDPEAIGRLGMLYHTYEIYRLAQPRYERAVALAPDDVRWRYYLGMVLRENGQPEAAVSQFDAILKITPDDAPTLMRRAAALLDVNQYERALQGYERVIRLRPNSPQAFYGAGRALFKLGRLDQCVAELRQAVTLYPHYGRAQYVLASALRDLGKTDEAAEQFQLAEANRDDEPPIDDPLEQALDELATGAIEALHQGVLDLQAGDVASAMERFEESLRLNPDLAETHANIGTALAMSGDLDRAAVHLERALRIQPGYAQAHYNLGLIAHRRSDPATAVAHFRAALTFNPVHFESHLGLGIDLPLVADAGASSATTMTLAADHLRTAIRLRPNDSRPYKRLATLLAGRGEFRESIGVLRSAVENIPRDLTLRNRLAWILATCPDDSLRAPEEAVAIAESVCATTQRRAARPLDTLAAAYAAAGRFEEAVETAGEALRVAKTAQHVVEITDRLQLYRSGTPYRAASHTVEE